MKKRTKEEWEVELERMRRRRAGSSFGIKGEIFRFPIFSFLLSFSPHYFRSLLNSSFIPF